MSLFKKTPPKDMSYHQLLSEIARVKVQMDNAYCNFQSAMDPDLIDCYIKNYEVTFFNAQGDILKKLKLLISTIG